MNYKDTLGIIALFVVTLILVFIIVVCVIASLNTEPWTIGRIILAILIVLIALRVLWAMVRVTCAMEDIGQAFREYDELKEKSNKLIEAAKENLR